MTINQSPENQYESCGGTNQVSHVQDIWFKEMSHVKENTWIMRTNHVPIIESCERITCEKIII